MPLPCDDARRILEGMRAAAHTVLGMHKSGGKVEVVCRIANAEKVEVLDRQSGRSVSHLEPLEGGVFAGTMSRRKNCFPYKLRVENQDQVWEVQDPYAFGPVIGEVDQHLFNEGRHQRLWEMLGAHVMEHEGVQGTHFAVWAPNASSVAIVGDFNAWDVQTHVMRPVGQSGVWELFIPGIGEGETYKYRLTDRHGNPLPQKADPVGFGSEHAPKNASIVRSLDGFDWHDRNWMSSRQKTASIDKPISIYEVHLGSWRTVPEEDNRPLSYLEHAVQMVDYAKDMGFTHIELMPISEFPFDGSWGYQPIGLFAPTIRYGSLNEFREFVQACHQADLGLILDWVPGHFPEDEHGLGRFDGTALYEHEDRREGFHPDWNTLLFNYGRREVSNYLISNAMYWLREHHIDGLRVDAVASMLYRDYSRNEGEWIPNVHGGRENLEAIEFLKSTNELAYADMPGIMTIAEESTAFPGVSAPTSHGGLGFGFKWNMGWMNDTLSYMQEDPVHRKYHHHKMTFGLHYAFSENFILPISHDEVVHGKGSMLAKMPGNKESKFANLRAYYGFMWGHPGKKLLFMGNEFAQKDEWNHNKSLDWHLMDDPHHAGLRNLVRDLNKLYTATPALYELDCRPEGFEWVEGDATEESMFIWVRHGNGETPPVLVVSNFTPVERRSRRIGVPAAGHWREVLNTDAAVYGGGDRGNLGGVTSETKPARNFTDSISITVPPLTTLFFELDKR